MANLNRLMVQREKEEASLEDLTLVKALVRLQNLIKLHGPGAVLENVCPRYSDERRLIVYALEPETDEEMDKRILREQQAEISLANRERLEFERLSLKFASGSK